MVCGHAFHSGWFKAVLLEIFCLYTPESAKISYALRHRDRIEIDTLISVNVVSPTTWEAHHSPRASPHLSLGINSYIHTLILVNLG